MFDIEFVVKIFFLHNSKPLIHFYKQILDRLSEKRNNKWIFHRYFPKLTPCQETYEIKQSRAEFVKLLCF